MMGCLRWLGLLATSVALCGAEKVFDLTGETLGAPPKGWRSVLAGEGQPGDWRVLLDAAREAPGGVAPGAASGAQTPVIAQVSRDPTDERFPLLVYDGEVFADFTLSLRFKLVAGTAEQMAGVAFRLRDENNFYVVRASGLGNTFRFYRVFEGRRDNPIGPEIAVAPGVWHDLVIEARGNKFRFKLDGKEPIPELTDSTFPDGKIALWTKSDSVSYFADLRLQFSPRESLAKQLVRETLQRYPRLLGLRIYATTSKRPELHVVASSDDAAVGNPGGETERNVIAQDMPYAGKGDGRYLVTMPLHDVNGDAIAAVRIELDTFPGQTDKNAVARARPIVKQLESQVTTLAELTE